MKKSVILLFSLLLSFSLFAEKPIVQDIKAHSAKGYKLTVTWSLPKNTEKPITSLQLYRSTRQITSFAQLTDASPIAVLQPGITGYTDTVGDFNDYYYAVIAVTDKPYEVILLSFNSTVTGAHVLTTIKKTEPQKKEYEKFYPEGTLRETPLPYIDFVEGLGKETKASDEALTSATSLMTSKKNRQPLLTQYIFEEDLVSPEGGDDYLLFEILKTSFVTRKYSDAINSLNKLIGTNISETTRNRAVFYLGEAEYLCGDYEACVRTFVKVEQAYPTLVKKWLDSALDKI